MQLNFDLLFMETISLQSDNDKEFVNSTLKNYRKRVNHIWGLPYHPQSQGAVEAFNKTILKFYILLMMRIMTHLN